MLGCLVVIVLLFLAGIVSLIATGGGGGGGDAVKKVEQKDQKAAQQEKPQKEGQAQDEQPEQQGGGGQADSGEDKGVIFRVTGDPGIKFQGSVATMDKQRSVQGVTPQDYPLKGVDTGMFSADVVSGNAQNMGASATKLTVQIVVDGKVVKQASTNAQYGMAQVSWSPAE